MSGIEISQSTLALEVIDAVGPGGDFLSTAHTLQNFRGIWQASLLDRNSHHGWVEAGRPNMIRTAREVAIEAIGSHVPLALSDSLKSELEEIVRRADQQLGVEG